jgi:replication fork protection complex subunit Csm3/Swi3
MCVQFADAARLLSFYQLWLDDLFPKAKFLDALSMVEKAGHKTTMHKARMDWINELKPTTRQDSPDFDVTPQSPRESSRIAPIFEQSAAAQRPKTPERDNLFGDDDIYGATPRAIQTTGQISNDTSAAPSSGDVPDEDDLDALMKESAAVPANSRSGEAASRSIFGPAKSAGENSHQGNAGNPADQEWDDLDALMAEAEANAPSKQASGSKLPERPTMSSATISADEEAAMAEMGDMW